MNLRRKWLTIAAGIAGGLALLSAGGGRGFRRYVRLNDDVTQLAQKNRQLAEQNARLAREIDALKKYPKALERAAREELGYVKPGEVVLNVE